MAYPKTEREWAERETRHIKAELKRADMTYEDLAEKLKSTAFARLRRVLQISWRTPPCRRIFFWHR